MPPPGESGRSVALAYADGLLGLVYPNERYLEQLYPHDAPSVAREMAAKQSSYGLFALAVLRAIGCHSPELDEPYARHVGTAMMAVKALAIRDGAWVEATRWQGREPSDRPALGDIVLLGLKGGGTAWGRGPLSSEEHLLVVVGYDEPTGCLVSVEGGQPGIAERTRRMLPAPCVAAPTELWLGHLGYALAADGRPLRGRRVAGWIALDKLDAGRA